MKRNLLLVLLGILILTVKLVSCGESSPGGNTVNYPDSVYGKAEFGKDKFN